MSGIPHNFGSQTGLRAYRLIINQTAFLAAASRLLMDSTAMAVGRIRRRTLSNTDELVLESWALASTPPSGLERPPLLDWAVMLAPNASTATLDTVLRIIQPKRSQLVVIIWLDRHQRSNLRATIWHDGKSTSPIEIRFIGSKMLVVSDLDDRVQRSLNGPGIDKGLADDDRESHDQLMLRESRPRGALRSLFDRNRTMHGVIAGAGGGGLELALQVVAAGFRHVSWIDGDRVGAENLDRMPLLTPADIGERKVECLAGKLHQHQPELLIRALSVPVHHPRAVEYLHGTRADVIFSFLDSDVGRIASSLLAREMEAIHIDVGTRISFESRESNAGEQQRVMTADVRLFEPGGRGCVTCVPPMPSEDLDRAMYQMSSPANCLERGEPRAWHELRAGSLLHLNSIAAALATETWLKWLSGEIRTSHWTRLRWQGLTPEVESASVAANQGCRFCY